MIRLYHSGQNPFHVNNLYSFFVFLSPRLLNRIFRLRKRSVLYKSNTFHYHYQYYNQNLYKLYKSLNYYIYNIHIYPNIFLLEVLRYFLHYYIVVRVHQLRKKIIIHILIKQIDDINKIIKTFLFFVSVVNPRIHSCCIE